MEEPGANVEEDSANEGGTHAKPDPPGLSVNRVAAQDADACWHSQAVRERGPTGGQELVHCNGYNDMSQSQNICT